MADEKVPAEQETTSQQQAAPEGYIEKKRFDGAIRKIEELTGRIRELESQLEGRASDVERLTSQLTVKDAEKTAAVSERDKRLQETIQQSTEKDRELEELRALKLKIDTVKEMGRTDLLKIVDKIPAMTDKDALKVVLADFASFADDAVKERERQLLSGNTPSLSGGKEAPTLPGNVESWEKHINSMPLGSTERTKAMDQYWTWLEENNR